MAANARTAARREIQAMIGLVTVTGARYAAKQQMEMKAIPGLAIAESA